MKNSPVIKNKLTLTALILSTFALIPQSFADQANDYKDSVVVDCEVKVSKKTSYAITVIRREGRDIDHLNRYKAYITQANKPGPLYEGGVYADTMNASGPVKQYSMANNRLDYFVELKRDENNKGTSKEYSVRLNWAGAYLNEYMTCETFKL